MSLHINIYYQFFWKKHIFYSFGAPVFPWCLVFFLDGILAMAVLFHVLVGVDSGLFKLIV
jgi:hypothetical protein